MFRIRQLFEKFYAGRREEDHQEEKMGKENSAAELIGNNQDLVREILLKVPAKDLLKCKLVSKQWMSIISSTEFCVYHSTLALTRSKGSLKPSALFIDMPHCPPSAIIALPLNPDGRQRLPLFDFLHFPDVRVLESCSGLLLCVSLNYDPSRWTYFICNPTTRKFKILPFPFPDDSPAKYSRYVRVSLAFDPLKSPHYKIIYVSERSLHGNFYDRVIDIYSSETRSWGSSKIEFTMKAGVDLSQGVFFNGEIHWYGRQGRSQYFDVDKECVKTMPMPIENDVACHYLGESGGRLNLVFAHRAAVFTFSIFEMQEDYSNWYLKYSLNLEAQMSNLWPITDGYSLICAIQSEEGDSIFAAYGGRAISYNIKNRTLKALQCPNPGFSSSGGIRACRYFETLSCV